MISIDLSGKVALVTGSSGELGRVMAFTLAQAGADVVLHCHRNIDSAQTIQQQIQGLGRQAWIVQADLRNTEGIDSLKCKILDQALSIDIVVANAVVQYTWKPMLEQGIEDYYSQFESTVLQSVRLAQAFIPAMVQRNTGRFIAINTECTMQCLPTQSAYVAGKRGLDGALRVLAREVGPSGVTVNQVAPGWTVSAKDRAAGTEIQESYAHNIPLRRRGTDQDVANAVLFLASDLASFLTGVYLPVTGGNIMPTV